MSMVCPQCSGVFEQRLTCPSCAVRLHYLSGRGPRPPMGLGRWRQSTLGQFALGLLLSQGLYYGLCRLYTSFELAFKEQLSLGESSPVVYVLLQCLQLTALLVGGMLAGAGQQTGPALGAAVGLFNGLLCVLLQPAPGQGMTTVALYSQPLLHAVFGTVAGWIGRTVWKPLPATYLGQPSRLMRRLGAARRSVSMFAGRIAWLRVATGVTLAVLGSLSATLILEAASVAGARASLGRYTEMLQVQDNVLTWEIKALAILFGGAIAGSNTRNGLKQGLFVGLTTVFVLFLALAFKGRATVAILLGTVVSTMCLSLVGGWFGSQLLPPVVSYKRTRGIGPAAAY